MKLKKIVEKLNLKVMCNADNLDVEVNNGYVSDLLSDVLANSEENNLWITLQIHPNIVAIASIKGLSGIVIINSREPEEETVKKAQEKAVPIMVSRMSAFELSGRLYGLGISGTKKMTMKEYKVDLHIHTCLSPCAQPDMLPAGIIKQAKDKGLDIIGICDHNSAENVSAVKKAGQREAVQVLGGMEICSSEEVHIMVFFNDDDALLEMQNIVYENLPGKNDESYFGTQLLADEYDRIVGSTEKLLIGSTSLEIEQIVESVHNLDGLAIASHIDRDSFSIIAQLGFIPDELSLDALELSWRCPSSEVNNYENYGLPLIKSSDAHFPSNIGKVVTAFSLSAPSFTEVAMAFHNVEGRTVTI